MNYVLYVVNANKANGYFSFLIYLISQQHLASLTYPSLKSHFPDCPSLAGCFFSISFVGFFSSTWSNSVAPQTQFWALYSSSTLYYILSLLNLINSLGFKYRPVIQPRLPFSAFFYEPIFVMTLLKSLNKQNNTSQTHLFFSNSPATILIQATTIALLNYIAKASQLVSLYPLPSSSIYSLRRRQVFKKLQSDHVTSLHTPFPGMALSINCKLFNVALPVLNNLVITYLSPSISSLHSNHANLFSFP